ncbi:hypothetical protein KSP40_PGU001543 [Platanthera guangdongensis]|uniref:Gnk2-homologous domain-containing protein n=1 Tax=Platanthera guangdongensis TaxID=2320717 RepID=A0ABR2MYX2_9ASPA
MESAAARGQSEGSMRAVVGVRMGSSKGGAKRAGARRSATGCCWRFFFFFFLLYTNQINTSPAPAPPTTSHPQAPTPPTSSASTPAVCSACHTGAAAAALNTSCTGNKYASVRNVYCVLRYSNHVIVSVLEYPSFSNLPSPENASNPELFGQQLRCMLSGILSVASSSLVRIAGGVNRVDAGMNYTVYGLAWCMADLLQENCYQCLDHALMSYTGCCDYSLGEGAITISCIVSYNILPFFNASLIENALVFSPKPTQFKTGKR